MQEDWQEIENQMRVRIWGGFEDPEVFKRYFVVDYLEDWRNHENQQLFFALTDRLFNEFHLEQTTWVFPTDHDRLLQAFEEMERHGILVVHNVQGTSSSAPYEGMEMLKERAMEFEVVYRLQSSGIVDAFDELEMENGFYYGWLDSAPLKIKGYVYYTGHHVDHVLEHGELYLGYQDFYNSHEIKQDIAGTIFRALQEAGLKVLWEGDADCKIQVHMKWQKRV